MRISKQAVRACIFIVVLVAVICCANYFLADDNTYTRIMLHEMYEQDDIDAVFIGGSVTYRHFDPDTWDEATGLRSFNCGSSSQRPVDSYHLMREVFKTHKPEYCIFSASFITFLNETEVTSYASRVQTQILFDYMPFSFNKLAYARDVYGMEQGNAWLPFLREEVAELSEIADVYEMKSSEDYLSYSYSTVAHGSEEYAGRGFVFKDQGKTRGMVGRLTTFRYSPAAVDREQVGYFLKLAELCRENGCRLIVVDSPLPYANMALQEDYRQILAFYEELAASAQAQRIPMDLAKPALFAAEDSDFYDAVHMNGHAARRYSRAVAGYFMQYIASDAQAPHGELFYGDYDELLAANERVYSTWLTDGEDGDYRALSTRPDGTSAEYRFSCRTQDGGEWTLLRGYGTDDVLASESVPDGALELRVEARLAGSRDDMQQYDIFVIK